LEGEAAITRMKSGSHILVVDDDAFFRDFVRDVLSEHGYRISEAVDGQEALKMLETTAVDMAIIDIEMPRMNGLDLVHQIKARQYRFPIIMISAYATMNMPSDILKIGIDAFLQKPVPMDKLITTVDQL
jgi:CheY-like chemotaxis protein